MSESGLFDLENQNADGTYNLSLRALEWLELRITMFSMPMMRQKMKEYLIVNNKTIQGAE